MTVKELKKIMKSGTLMCVTHLRGVYKPMMQGRAVHVIYSQEYDWVRVYADYGILQYRAADFCANVLSPKSKFYCVPGTQMKHFYDVDTLGQPLN